MNRQVRTGFALLVVALMMFLANIFITAAGGLDYDAPAALQVTAYFILGVFLAALFAGLGFIAWGIFRGPTARRD